MGQLVVFVGFLLDIVLCLAKLHKIWKTEVVRVFNLSRSEEHVRWRDKMLRETEVSNWVDVAVEHGLSIFYIDVGVPHKQLHLIFSFYEEIMSFFCSRASFILSILILALQEGHFYIVEIVWKVVTEQLELFEIFIGGVWTIQVQIFVTVGPCWRITLDHVNVIFDPIVFSPCLKVHLKSSDFWCHFILEPNCEIKTWLTEY